MQPLKTQRKERKLSVQTLLSISVTFVGSRVVVKYTLVSVHVNIGSVSRNSVPIDFQKNAKTVKLVNI